MTNGDRSPDKNETQHLSFFAESQAQGLLNEH